MNVTIIAYCGFSYDRDIDRYTLSDAEIIENVQILVNKGFCIFCY